MPSTSAHTIQHTPGPWRIEDPMPASFSVMAPDRPGHPNEYRIIASVDTDVECGILLQEAEANARLIAAAPDLLAALQGLMGAEWRPKTGPLQYDSLREDAWAAADAAIAKATGGER